MSSDHTRLAVATLGGLASKGASGAARGSTEGNAPQVLFIHGFGADRHTWVGNAPALFDIATVRALDLPGHGESSATESSGELQEITSQVLTCFTPDNNNTPIHLVGHSLGAALAVLCAVAQPQSVASLTLIAPVGLGKGVSADFTETFVNLDDEEKALELLRTLINKPGLIASPLAALLLKNLDKPGARETLRKIADGLHQSKPILDAAISQLKSTNIDYQVIWGLQDNINPPQQTDEAEFGGRWLWLNNCGHLPHIEHRTIVNDAIKELINK